MSQRAKYAVAFGLGALTFPVWFEAGALFARWHNRPTYVFGVK